MFWSWEYLSYFEPVANIMILIYKHDGLIIIIIIIIDGKQKLYCPFYEWKWKNVCSNAQITIHLRILLHF